MFSIVSTNQNCHGALFTFSDFDEIFNCELASCQMRIFLTAYPNRECFDGASLCVPPQIMTLPLCLSAHIYSWMDFGKLILQGLCQRTNDLSVMDLFINLKFKPKQLQNLNRFRIYLQVIFLSDITSADGTKIIPQTLSGQQ